MDRPMFLAQNGWYPADSLNCKKEIIKCVDHSIFIEGKNPVCCIVPHAGWYFCGRISVNTIRLMKEKNGTIRRIFIFGGHLNKNNLPILETFDNAQTPFGTLTNNRQVLQALSDKNLQRVDFLRDNTIEILLPIIQHFFGNIEITAIYMPPGPRSIEIAKFLFEKFGKSSIFIGSTDLTHYGPNYGFFHTDKSVPPVNWVTNTNDKGYIDLLLSLSVDESLAYAEKNKSACSSGAVAACMTIAKQAGVEKGVLIDYQTSYSVMKNDSFVGYAGVIF